MTDPANRLLSISGGYTESRGYNVMGQLTNLTNGSVNFTYSYSSSQNNGKITGQTDNISGEQVVYAYDSLNRLASAGATNSSWGQSYSYDGFGNLQNQNVTTGTAPALSVVYNVANNRQTGDTADANGNIFANGVTAYDVSNRIATTVQGGVSQTSYGYAPGNKRIWKGTRPYDSNTGQYDSPFTADQITFWSVTGQKLGDYNVTGDPNVVYPWDNYHGEPTPAVTVTLATANYYFGGKLIRKGTPGSFVTYFGSDRLGSFGKYYPWGQEKPSATTNNTEKFTSYFRDSETGLDYAKNRYHQPGVGRFLSPDSYMASGGPADPESWNRYAYTRGDPMNRVDVQGLEDDGPGDGTEVDCDPVIDPATGNIVCAGNPNQQTTFGNGKKSGPPILGAIMKQEWSEGLLLAIEKLNKYKDCAALFGTTGQAGQTPPYTPVEVLARISTSYTFGAITSPNGYITGATTTGTGTASLQIDLQGDTITVSAGVTIKVNNDQNATFGSSDPNDWADLILHELGHAYWDLYGAGTSAIVPDGADPQQSIKNQATITAACQ